MKIGQIKIPVSYCTAGIYLRWWWNGWHYFNFTNGYEITMKTESMGTQVTRMFSVISKIERPTRIKSEYAYKVTLEGIPPSNIGGFTGLLMAEKVMQYEGGIWREVEITRGEHVLKEEGEPSYILNFEITREELPITSSVYKKSLRLYLGDVLCDMDDDEVVPINKQTNDIAEMQDRQSDFTAQFKIKKTRVMRALFELAGEVGVNTTFPYEKQFCRLIQDNIEMITNGIMILDKVDDQYYYVSVLSGNQNFFREIDKLKLTDLTLASTNHDWTIADQKTSHDASPDTDYVYPLCEPSDDAGIAPIRLAGNIVEMYGGWIWPFVRAKTIWDEIFSNAGFICEGDILTNPMFMELFLPISSLKVTKAYTDKYLYSGQLLPGDYTAALTMFTGITVINGDLQFATGNYQTLNAEYRFRIVVIAGWGMANFQLYSGAAPVANFTFNAELSSFIVGVWDCVYDAAAGEWLSFWTPPGYLFYGVVMVLEINDARIGFASTVTPRLHLPNMIQTDFVKMICNMFGLVPDVTPRDRKIKFWNYSELYRNVPIARNWSAYLSEREDESEFKFGDYAQSNYLKYKGSDDVIIDNGKGTMLIEDETLPLEQDVFELPISTCDEVTIAFTAPTVNVSRIAFNEWYDDAGTYEQGGTIDPRIVYIGKRATGKELILWDTVLMNVNHVHIASPKMATSIDVSFSYLVTNYAWFSRLLTKTNLRRVKLNLPVYEVAGLKHNIPVYLSQYKAYFYVNRINNYVPGQLCTIDLIKL